MREAYRNHGYTMRAIAEYANLNHSSVSRLIKKGDDHARFKSCPSIWFKEKLNGQAET